MGRICPTVPVPTRPARPPSAPGTRTASPWSTATRTRGNVTNATPVLNNNFYFYAVFSSCLQIAVMFPCLRQVFIHTTHQGSRCNRVQADVRSILSECPTWKEDFGCDAWPRNWSDCVGALCKRTCGFCHRRRICSRTRGNFEHLCVCISVAA